MTDESIESDGEVYPTGVVYVGLHPKKTRVLRGVITTVTCNHSAPRDCRACGR